MSGRDARSARRRAVRAGSVDKFSQEGAQIRSASLHAQSRAREVTGVQGEVTSGHIHVTSERGYLAGGNGVKVEDGTLGAPVETLLTSKDTTSLTVPDDLRSDSKTDSDESSIAVDCHTGPSEVIVKGRNVRKIHVKFPPRPPSGEVEGVRAHSGLPRQTSQLSLTHRSVSSGQQPQEHGDEFEYKPLSQGDHRHSLPPTALPALTARQPGQPTALLPDPLRDSGMLSAISLDLGLNSGAYEWDRKVKHDIINGIEYFEKKNAEMKEVNGRILRELERLSRLHTESEERLRREQDHSKVLRAENTEIKQKLDSLEKENGKLKEESVSYWKARVKSEELYMELKRESDREMKSLREQVEVKDKEVTQLRNLTRTHKTEKTQHRAQQDDNLELFHKISRLEEEITRLKSEKDRMNDSTRRQKDDMDGMRKKLKEQGSELENRFSQFLVLKKSFNDLNSEHDKLKSQLRSRRSSQHLSINNNTWPKNPDSKKGESDTAVSYLDMRSKLSKTGTKKASVPLLGHKRNPSDTHSSTTDSLPPVPSPVK